MCTHTEESSQGSIEAEICWPLYSWCAAAAQQDAAGDFQSPPPSITKPTTTKTQNPPTQEPQSSPNPKLIPKLQNGDIPLVHSCNSHFAGHHLPISPKFPHSRITTMQTISIQRNCLPSLLHLCSRIKGEDGLL